MTWTDPIVDEIHRIRAEHAARFNYDLDAMFRDLKEREKRSGRKIVSYADNPNESVSSANAQGPRQLPVAGEGLPSVVTPEMHPKA